MPAPNFPKVIRQIRVAVDPAANPPVDLPLEVQLDGEQEIFFAFDPLIKCTVAALAGFLDPDGILIPKVTLTVDGNNVILRAEASL